MPKKKSRKKKSKKKVRGKTKKRKIIRKKNKSSKKDRHEELIYKTKSDWVNKALINKSGYEKKYSLSLKDNDGFWKKEGKRITWIKPYTKIKDVKYSKSDVHIKWFYDGTLNASANCIDRHLKKNKNKTAIIWVGDDPKVQKKISYKQLHEEVSKAANGLKSLGIKRGDRVTIYLTMVPELAYTMLACARIGAIHSIIFGGFSPDSIAGRINDCKSDYIITADEGVRGGKIIPLKSITDEALVNCPNVKKCIIVKRTGNRINWDDERDVWYHEITKNVSKTCEPEEMNAEDPLFILYTSGSTGKPKGVLHTTGGYMVYASMTHQYIFNYKPKDIYWCTADIGWITGHSYIIYGPLSNGATTIMFEGIPTYPDNSRWWQIVDKFKVNIFYTAPTAIRALMREGDKPVKKTSRKSLKLLGTVGEPINPEAWMWYYKTVGDSRCPIVDTWWQTETGGILISPQTGAIDLKPGSATKPLLVTCAIAGIAIFDGPQGFFPILYCCTFSCTCFSNMALAATAVAVMAAAAHTLMRLAGSCTTAAASCCSRGNASRLPAAKLPLFAPAKVSLPWSARTVPALTTVFAIRPRPVIVPVLPTAEPVTTAESPFSTTRPPFEKSRSA